MWGWINTLFLEVCDPAGACDTTATDLDFTNIAPVFVSGCGDALYGPPGSIIQHQLVVDPIDCDPSAVWIVDVSPTPVGALSISGNGEFTFETNIADAGMGYVVTVGVSDGHLESTCDFIIYVSNYLPTLPGVAFYQIDFVFDSVQQINSDWGSVEVDVIQVLNDYGAERLYMNCWLDDGWFVQNLVIDSDMADSIKTYFGLKIPPGTEVTELPVYIQFDLFPLMSFYDGPQGLYPVGVREFNAEGAADDGAYVTVIPTAPEPIIFWDPLENYETVWKNNPGENVECAHNQCVPMSVANSLQWLENTYSSIDVPQDHVPGRDGDGSLVGQLDEWMDRWSSSRSNGDGVGLRDMVQGKLEYLEANGLGDKVVNKHQVDQNSTDHGWLTPADEVHPTDTSVRSENETPASGHVSWDWINEQIEDGEDVEMIYGYYDSLGERQGGHAVRVFGSGKTNGRPWLMVKHDALQTDDDPGDSLGLQEWFQWVDTLPDGRMTFGSSDQIIDFAFSESPVDHAPRLHFYQYDFLLDGVEYANSDWGAAVLTLSPETDTGMIYLNISVNGSWQVENMPLWRPTSDEGDRTVVFSFDLGVSPGTDISYINYGYLLTSAPQDSMPIETDVANVQDRQNIGEAGAGGEAVPALEPAKPAKGGAVAAPTKHAHKNFPNQDCGDKECAPVSVSNSLKFLNKKHGMGLDDADLSLAKMKTACGFIGGWGCDRDAWWTKKKKYMEKNKIPVTTRKITNLADLAAEIDAGQDVELQGDWHTAAIVSITDLGGGKFKIEVAHDKKQGAEGGQEIDEITYNPTTKKFEGSPGWFDGSSFRYAVVECPKKEPTEGKNMHNQDEYIPPDGDPTGTIWHELWPNYCVMWEMTDWEDNGDGILSFCDYVTFTNQSTQEESREHIEEVTATITIVPVGKLDDTLYLDFWYGRPDMDPIIPEPGDQWHEIYPEYCTMYEVEGWEDNGTGQLDSCDYLLLRTTSGANAGNVEMYHVEAIETDIVTVPAPLPTSCCLGPIRGNINYDPGDGLDISDLVYLVDFMFTGGPAPQCLEEADVNGSGSIDISDLVYLVDYMFTGGPPPAPCP